MLGQCISSFFPASKAFGKDGLMRSRKNESYSFEFKLHVVELYLTTEVSYQELALSVGINNPPLIARWVNDHSYLKIAIRIKVSICS